MINSKYDCVILKQLKDELKKTGSHEAKKIVLQTNIATNDLGLQLTHHPKMLSVLAPLDYYLFPNLNRYLASITNSALAARRSLTPRRRIWRPSGNFLLNWFECVGKTSAISVYRFTLLGNTLWWLPAVLKTPEVLQGEILRSKW